jgi:thiosulfate dehydrogenase [quinone] large subunit
MQRRHARLLKLMDQASAHGLSTIVLRAFLGVTFTFAGLQKLANPNFFRSSSPSSFYRQLQGSIATSPLHHLLDFALHVPTAIAVVISLAEVSVGIATITGLFGRVAACGGMALALTFFLTVSFNDNPYYYGADIVFLFAWTPLAIGGPGPLSLDSWRTKERAPRPSEQDVTTNATQHGIDRRTFMTRAGAIGVGTAVLGASGLSVLLGHVFSTNDSQEAVHSLGGDAARHATTTTSAAHTKSLGTYVGQANQVPLGGAASFTDPIHHVPAVMVHPSAEQYRAFSAICPHAGCTVGFDKALDVFVCPCHGSQFDAKTGAVLQGPAPTGLSELSVKLGPGGRLYVED